MIKLKDSMKTIGENFTKDDLDVVFNAQIKMMLILQEVLN